MEETFSYILSRVVNQPLRVVFSTLFILERFKIYPNTPKRQTEKRGLALMLGTRFFFPCEQAANAVKGNSLKSSFLFHPRLGCPQASVQYVILLAK